MKKYIYGILSIAFSLLGLLIIFKSIIGLFFIYFLGVLGFLFAIIQIYKNRTVFLAILCIIVSLIEIGFAIYVDINVFNSIYNPPVYKWENVTTRQNEYARELIDAAETLEDCLEISHEGFESNCINSLEFAPEDVGNCELVFMPNTCYWNKALELRDAKICDLGTEIEESEEVLGFNYEECYEHVYSTLYWDAYHSRDAELCEKIYDEKIRNACLDNVERKEVENEDELFKFY